MQEVSQKATDPSVGLCVALLVSEPHFFLQLLFSSHHWPLPRSPLGFFIHAEMTATAISAYLCALHLDLKTPKISSLSITALLRLGDVSQMCPPL